MAQVKTMTVAQQIGTLFEAGSAVGLSDRQLLDRFHSSRDSAGEAAFAALVARHGPMVWRVCRQLLDDRHLAEDAFQATFLVLAQKSRSIRDSDRLANWLYGVASRTARRAQARLARQRQKEEASTVLSARPMAVAEPMAAPADEAVMASEQFKALHGAIERLPDRFRLPVVLCYLEGLTVHQAASQLRWSHGTVRSRMARAREKLRRALTRRGFVVPPAALAGLLESPPASASIAAVPCALRAQTALRFASTPPAAALPLSASASALAQEVLKSMLIHKLKLAAVSVLLLGAAAAGAGITARSFSSTDEVGKRETQQVPQAARAGLDATGQPVIAPPPARRPAFAQSLRVVVQDPDGKPVSDAKVLCSVWTVEKDFRRNRDYQTDASGTAVVELPKTYTIVRLFTSKPSFAPMFTHWEQKELAAGETIPAEYTIRLEPGVSASGRIVDEAGIPVVGAKVQVQTANDVSPRRGDAQTVYNMWLAEGADAAITDADGRWQINNVPDHPKAELTLLVTHPDHVSDQSWGEIQRAGGITTAMLLNGTAALKLKGGIVVHGRVTDDAGHPVGGATIVRGDDPYFASTQSEFLTGADGRFRLPAMAAGKTALTVVAAGWAPQERVVDVKPGLPAQDFPLERGKPIRLRVVDSAGRPVSAGEVIIRGWKGRQALHNHHHPKVHDTKIPRGTDSNGNWEWTWAPNSPVQVTIGGKGFAYQELDIGPGDSGRTIALRAEHRVRGRVTDAMTGKPIAAFTVVPVDVFRKDWFVAEPNNGKPGKDGQLDYLATRADIPIRLRILAMGYRAQDGPIFRIGDDGARNQDFRLQPSPPIAGRLVDVSGRAAAKVQVALATPTQSMSLWFRPSESQTYTDSSGRFAFPDPGEPWAIVARSNAGFALGEFSADQHDAGTMTLRPYATIRGQFHDGGKPVQGATILIQVIRASGWAQPKLDNDATGTVTGPDGRFELTDVPPVPLSLRAHLGPWKDESFRSGPHVPLHVQPGQNVALDLGGEGATLIGKVTLTGNVPADLDCNYSLSQLIRREPGITPPPEIAKLGFDITRGWRDSWFDSNDGSAYLSTLQYWFVKLAPDGSFRISGVPPGEYDLAVRVYAKPNGCLVDPLARVVTHVKVTAADVARGRLDLPEVSAQAVPVPAVGHRPSLRFARADGREGSLAEYRGSYTLVHFWASWCGPCKQQMPALRQLTERFAARGLNVLGLSVDEDLDAWREAIERYGLRGLSASGRSDDKRLDHDIEAVKRRFLIWSQGRLSNPAETGVSSVPEYWLLDPSGKIVSKAADPDQLLELLDDRLK